MSFNKRGTILVAEDNEINQKLISAILSKNDFHFKMVENGAQALALFQNDTYTLVLMDCQMPIMDGLTATQNIRQFERERNIKRVPIIALTANAMKGDKEKCLEKGMDDFLSKPFRMNDLLVILDKWLPVTESSSKAS